MEEMQEPKKARRILKEIDPRKTIKAGLAKHQLAQIELRGP